MAPREDLEGGARHPLHGRTGSQAASLPEITDQGGLASLPLFLLMPRRSSRLAAGDTSTSATFQPPQEWLARVDLNHRPFAYQANALNRTELRAIENYELLRRSGYPQEKGGGSDTKLLCHL